MTNNPTRYTDPFGAIAGIDDLSAIVLLGTAAVLTAGYLAIRQMQPVVQGGPGSWGNPIPIRGMEDLLGQIGRGGPFLKSPKDKFKFALGIAATLWLWYQKNFGQLSEVDDPNDVGINTCPAPAEQR